MPKIPTFTTQATITGEVGSVKSNIQNNTTDGAGLNGVRDNDLEVFNRYANA